MTSATKTRSKYPREWFAENLWRIREAIWAPLPDDEWGNTFDRIKKVGEAVMEVTGMDRKTSAEYVSEKLLVSKTEQQKFFEQYAIENEEAVG